MVFLNPSNHYSPNILLSLVCLEILVILGNHVGSAADCRQSNCKFINTEECQHSESVFCDLQKIQKIQITNASFPKHVKDIILTNVQAMEIQAEAIASLASLESIELTQIGNLTLLSRSLARINEFGKISVTLQQVKSLQLHSESFADWGNSGSQINIEDVIECHMSQKTISSTTLIRTLQLQRITALTIKHGAFAAESNITNIWMSQIKSLIIETGAFAPHATVQNMEFIGIKSLKLQSGAIARNSYIQNVRIAKVDSLVIDSGGIQADISKLTIRDVVMGTCENNTFGGKIQDLSLVSSHINLTKYGCIWASTGWNNLLVQNSTLYHIKADAIHGTIDQVQIKYSKIGTVDTEGITLNVTRFTLEGGSIAELKEKALAVSATEGITLKANLHIQDIANESMQFAPETNVFVSNLKLGTTCTCDMENLALQLGLPRQIHLGHGNDPKLSNWFNQTRCVSNTTTPTLAEYYEECCPDFTTTAITTTTSSVGSSISGGSGWSDGSVNMWSVIVTAIAALWLNGHHSGSIGREGAP